MKKALISMSLIMMTSTLLFADTNSTKKIAPISEAEKKAVMDANIFEVPSAGALANHLQRSLGKIEWSKFMNLKVQGVSTFSLRRRALHLGAEGADAYFLAIANDAAHLKGISISIKNTLNKIMLDKKPLSKRVGKENLKELKKSIKAKKWAKVLDKITTLKDKISQELIKHKENDLKVLNDVGGWLEGYRLSVEGFNANFTAETTDVLVQGDLIQYLLTELKGVQGFNEKEMLIEVLTDIKKVLSHATKEYRLSKKQVVELSKILSKTKTIL